MHQSDNQIVVNLRGRVTVKDQFKNATHGIMAGSDYANNGVILKTSDGGVTWTDIPVGLIGGIVSIAFPDSNTGYAACRGGGGEILKTINGGDTWTSKISGLPSISSIFFTDENTGYALDYFENVMKTKDGGDSWEPQYLGACNLLSSIYFIDNDTGFIVGRHGSILKTTNGGGYPASIDGPVCRKNELHIYPNPTSSLLTIETSPNLLPGDLSIFNLTGQKMVNCLVSETKTNIDITQFPVGMYFMVFSNPILVESAKIIKH